MFTLLKASGFDAHTHRRIPEPGIDGVHNLRAGTDPLIHASPFGRFSAGIHPWDAGDRWRLRLEALDTLLLQPCCVALGEVGFDRLRGPALREQIRLFEMQLERAAGFPVVLHVVRAWEELLVARRRHRQGIWIVHGFRGSADLAARLADEGIGLSFGVALRSARPPAEALRRIPPEDLLLETDDDNCRWQDIALAAARLLDEPVESVLTRAIGRGEFVFGRRMPLMYRRVAETSDATHSCVHEPVSEDSKILRIEEEGGCS